MSNPRYFYPPTRLHHAYSMYKDFGMQFELQYPGAGVLEPVVHMDWQRILGGQIRLTMARPFYIHADSLYLLAPKIGDVLYTKAGGGVSIEEIMSEARQANATTLIHRGAKIIQRDGKPFHWPESEAA